MLLMALALVQATAGAPPAPAPAAPPKTLQEQFDTANAALEAGRPQEALDGFDRAEAWPKASPRTRGTAQLRKGLALLSLDRTAEGLATLRAGLATTAGVPALGPFRLEAALAISNAARRDLDYAASVEADRLMLEEAADDPSYRLQALLDLAAALMFDQPALALDYADKAVAMVAAPNTGTTVIARAYDVRARVKLNVGDKAGAIKDLKVALKELGGVTEKTDVDDVVVRSDLAIANLLGGDKTEARRLMAMTGAGRLPDSVFRQAAQMDMAPCSTTLRPDDVGVVEFSVNNAGQTLYATPIYASRQGMAVLDLARAVRGWTWRPDDIAKVSMFFRTAVRVELRCSTAVERPPIDTAVTADVLRWFAGHNAALPGIGEDGGTSPSLDAIKTAITQAGGPSGDPRRMIALLAQLGSHPLTSYETSVAVYRRALDIARDEHAPPVVLALLRTRSVQKWQDAYAPRKRAVLDLLGDAAKPEYAADPRARALLILVANDMSKERASPEMTAAVDSVARDGKLDLHDPLRVGALLRLSAIQAQVGDIDGARVSYLRTGLDAQQCALVDAQPAVKKLGIGSDDYPAQAMMWGVSGWSRVEFDIQPDGRTVNQRAILSYPPFTFSEVAAKGLKDTRYTQTYRPDGGLGCGGASIGINFIMPK